MRENRYQNWCDILLMPLVFLWLTVSKSFEKSLFDRLKLLFQSGNLISDFQFGFWQNHSKIKCTLNVLWGKIYCVIISGVTRAYDAVWLSKTLSQSLILLHHIIMTDKVFGIMQEDWWINIFCGFVMASLFNKCDLNFKPFRWFLTNLSLPLKCSRLYHNFGTWLYEMFTF